jgi:hypothetical protein
MRHPFAVVRDCTDRTVRRRTMRFKARPRREV